MKHIPLIGEVDSDMLKFLLNQLMNIGDSEKVTIHLSTTGGDVYSGFAIYDLICRLDNVDIIICGSCMSMGMLILQGATRRYALPNTELMVHFGEELNETPSDQMHGMKLTKKMKYIIQERSNVTKRTVTNWFKTNTYFGVDHALKVGLIDGIIYD